MNDCGGCKAEWYNSTTGDVISCPYYDRLLEKKQHESHVRKEIVNHGETNDALGHAVSEPKPTTNNVPKDKVTLEKTLSLLYQLIDILRKEVAQQKARTTAVQRQLAQRQNTQTVSGESGPNTKKPKLVKKKPKRKPAPKPKRKPASKPKPTTKGPSKDNKPKPTEENKVIGGVPVDFQKIDFFGENKA